MPAQWREAALQATLTPEFLALILQQVAKRGPIWKTLLCLLGNSTAPRYAWLAHRLITADYVQAMLPLVAVCAAEAQEEVADLLWTVEDVCLWSVANLSSCAVHSHRVAESLLPFVPILYDRLGSLPGRYSQSYMHYMEYHGGLVRHSSRNYGYEVGMKFDDCVTKLDELGTKDTPEVIKYRPL